MIPAARFNDDRRLDRKFTKKPISLILWCILKVDVCPDCGYVDDSLFLPVAVLSCSNPEIEIVLTVLANDTRQPLEVICGIEFTPGRFVSAKCSHIDISLAPFKE